MTWQRVPADAPANTIPVLDEGMRRLIRKTARNEWERIRWTSGSLGKRWWRCW